MAANCRDSHENNKNKMVASCRDIPESEKSSWDEEMQGHKAQRRNEGNEDHQQEIFEAAFKWFFHLQGPALYKRCNQFGFSQKKMKGED